MIIPSISKISTALRRKIDYQLKLKWKKNFVDEVDLIFKVLMRTDVPKSMIDVGAHHGNSLKRYVKAGWHIYAFEPDPRNRRKLMERFGNQKNLLVDPRALGAIDQKNLDFYTSPDSSGISGLSPFQKSHSATDQVDMITLRTFQKEKNMKRPGFLKIDTEGHDLFVLQGYPWETGRPDCVICEFEDKKTLPLGYDFKQLANFLLEENYHLIVSEWDPIEKYGEIHNWKAFHRYPMQLSSPEAWGNIIGFQNRDLFEHVAKRWIRKPRKS